MQKWHYLPILFIIVFIPLTVNAVTEPELIEFKNIGEWVAFENQMKRDLNMPIVGKNLATGQPAINKQVTVDYSSPRFNDDTKDLRIVSFIDKYADKQGKTVITKNDAQGKGWKFD